MATTKSIGGRFYRTHHDATAALMDTPLILNCVHPLPYDSQWVWHDVMKPPFCTSAAEPPPLGLFPLPLPAIAVEGSGYDVRCAGE